MLLLLAWLYPALCLLPIVLSNDQDDIYRSMSPEIDRIVTRLLKHETPWLPDARARDLNRQLLQLTIKLRYNGSASELLPQIRRLVRAGATTSAFERFDDDYISDIISRRFLYQVCKDQKPDQDLFKCISFLIMAGQAALTNRSYVGNGDASSAELIEWFLSSGQEYYTLRILAGDKKNMRILFGQCKRLLQLIYAQRVVYAIPYKSCRLCQRIWHCKFGDHPRDDHLLDLIASFIIDDLVHLKITGVSPISPSCNHYDLSRHLPFLHDKILIQLFQQDDLRDLILNLLVSDQELVSTFLNGMHRSTASRRLLRRLLQMRNVPALLLRTPFFMCEFIRRKDTKSVLVLASAVPPQYDTLPFSYEFRKLHRCADRIGTILQKHALISC